MQPLEAELLELRNAEDYLQNEIMRIDTLKCSQMALTAELDNWSELFDKHDLTRKKAMLYNIIERIDIWRGRVEITYKIRLDAFAGADSGNCEISELAPEKHDFDGKICYTDVSADTSHLQALQIHQKREAVFATPSGRQTSKERKYLAVK